MSARIETSAEIDTIAVGDLKATALKVVMRYIADRPHTDARTSDDRQILQELHQGERSVSEMCGNTGLSVGDVLACLLRIAS